MLRIGKDAIRERLCRIKNWMGNILYLGKTLLTGKYVAKEIFTSGKTFQVKIEGNTTEWNIFGVEIKSARQNNLKKRKSLEGIIFLWENDSCGTLL